MHNLSVKILIIVMAYFSSISMTYSDDKTMQKISNFLIDKTEVISMAEKKGGGLVYENGWVQKKGWNWTRPYGLAALDNEPVVHINFNEAENYCKWNKKRIPTKKEWELAAYTEFK